MFILLPFLFSKSIGVIWVVRPSRVAYTQSPQASPFLDSIFEIYIAAELVLILGLLIGLLAVFLLLLLLNSFTY